MPSLCSFEGNDTVGSRRWVNLSNNWRISMLEPEGSDYWDTRTHTQVEFTLWVEGLVSAVTRLLVNLELDIECSEYSGGVARNEKWVRAENLRCCFYNSQIAFANFSKKILRNEYAVFQFTQLTLYNPGSLNWPAFLGKVLARQLQVFGPQFLNL